MAGRESVRRVARHFLSAMRKENTGDDAQHEPDCDCLKCECLKASIAAFADAINTGFYVNSYTTKQCPTMEGVLENLRLSRYLFAPCPEMKSENEVPGNGTGNKNQDHQEITCDTRKEHKPKLSIRKLTPRNPNTRSVISLEK